MGFIFKGILAVIWLLVVPCLAGGFYFRREKRTCGEYLLAGYTLLFAITELLSLTMIFTKQPLHVLTITYGVVAGVLAFLGARSLYKKRQKETGEGAGTYCGRRTEATGISPELVVAGILILFQLVVVVLYAHMDEDDAFYVGTATTAVETDSLYAYNPYTGAAYNVLPSRYILSPFPAFLAVTSRLCGGLHPAIVAHTVFPAVFVFLAYVVLFSVQPHILQGKGWRTGDFYDPLCRDPVVLRIFGIQFRNFYNGQDLAGKSCAGRGIFTIFISALYGDFYAGKTGISMEPGFSGKWSLLSVFLNGNHACPSSDGSICSA